MAAPPGRGGRRPEACGGDGALRPGRGASIPGEHGDGKMDEEHSPASISLSLSLSRSLSLSLLASDNVFLKQDIIKELC